MGFVKRGIFLKKTEDYMKILGAKKGFSTDLKIGKFSLLNQGKPDFYKT